VPATSLEMLSTGIRALLETSQEADRRRDAELFASILAPEGTFQLGPFPEVQGRGAVRESVAAFFATIADMDQRFLRGWEHPGGLVYEAEVSYRLVTGAEVTIPYCNVWDVSDGLISRYRVYIDLAAMRDAG